MLLPVEDHGLVVVQGVVAHRVEHILLVQPVHHLDRVERDQHAPTRAAGDPGHRVRLQGGLDLREGGDEGHLEVVARTRDRAKQSSASPVHAHMALPHLVQALEGEDEVGNEKHNACDRKRRQGHSISASYKRYEQV